MNELEKMYVEFKKKRANNSLRNDESLEMHDIRKKLKLDTCTSCFGLGLHEVVSEDWDNGGYRTDYLDCKECDCTGEVGHSKELLEALIPIYK